MQLVWSIKGGVGASLVAAGLALARARPGARSCLLVDLAGDQQALFRSTPVPVDDVPGVAEWTRAGPEVPSDALTRLEREVVPGLAVLPRGRGPLAADRLAVLVALLGDEPRHVVVDVGQVDADDPRVAVLGEGASSLLVTRACPLAVDRLVDLPARPSGVVVVRDVGRSATVEALARAAAAPVVAELDVDPAIGRAVDAGLGVRRLPRAFLRALGQVS